MKKSELKKELEIAKATLDLAMIALRLASKKRFSIAADILSKNSADQNAFIPKGERVISDNSIMPKFEVEKLIKKLKENQTIIPKPEPQAGDKIVESNNSDWFTKNDDGTYTIKLSPNTKLFEWIAKEDDSKVTGWNEPNQNESEYPDYVCMKDFNRYIIKGTILKYGFVNKYLGKCYQSTTNKQMCYAPELFKDNKEYFEVYQPKNATPLSDLNKEVQEEQSYIIQAKEAVDKFMPLVNGWRANDPCGLRDAEANKIVWSLSDHNHKKAAIKVAIAHFELIQKQGGWLTHIDCVQIINELQKMLSE